MPGQTDERTARLITIVRQQSWGLMITLEYKDWPSSCGSLLNYKNALKLIKFMVWSLSKANEIARLNNYTCHDIDILITPILLLSFKIW